MEEATVYEYDGELYENTELFLQALADAYNDSGADTEEIVDTLERYGFTLADINVRPEDA